MTAHPRKSGPLAEQEGQHERWRFNEAEMHWLSSGLHVLEGYAREQRLVGLYGWVRRVRDDLAELFVLLDAFLRSPGRRVHGREGVVDQLDRKHLSGELDVGTSANALYHRLRNLELDPAAFRRPDVRMSTLVQESGKLHDVMPMVQEQLDRLPERWRVEMGKLLQVMDVTS